MVDMPNQTKPNQTKEKAVDFILSNEKCLSSVCKYLFLFILQAYFNVFSLPIHSLKYTKISFIRWTLLFFKICNKNYCLCRTYGILTEMFIGWPKYPLAIWPNEVYFLTLFTLWSTRFFLWCCSAWIIFVKNHHEHICHLHMSF